MASELRRLAPSEMVRLLNSTPLGTVIGDRQFFRHRQSAGFRIGDGRRVDLFRYMGWVIGQRRAPAPPPADYAAVKEAAAQRNRALAEAGREIGALPAVADPQRKARARLDFRFFCVTYFPNTFRLPFSPDHMKIISKVEKAVLEGGLFAMAMPRGSGKTSIVESACLWATLFGHKDFVCLIGATEPHAAQLLESMKTEIDSSPMLLADFPEVCFPFRALDGIANRCGGQLYRGERTHIVWTDKEIVLPTIKDSPSSGAIIKTCGLTGRIRGLKFKRQDGHPVRPSLVILDDIQTDESARSLSQCATRERLLAGAVLGLAGPKKKISGVLPCTVIRPGDVADVILDREKHPEWNGERTKMVYSFPTNEKLWARYAEIRADSFRAHGDQRDATTFYVANREAMDEGSEVSWPENYEADELSGLQHAMNIRLTDEAAFMAEYQNDPLPEVAEDKAALTPEQICGKLNGLKRGLVPVWATHLTAFIDVQGKLLYWAVCAWGPDFTGAVLDYGAYPDQKRPYFLLRDAQRTLQTVAKGTGLEGAIYAGLTALCGDILSREWAGESGGAFRVGLCLVDANWGASTDVVYQFCRQDPHAAQIFPSHGRFVGAGSRPFSEYAKRPGDRIGLNWRVPNAHQTRGIRHLLFDVNYWKSFVASRLAVHMGDPGCLSLYGKNPEAHQLFADHLTAEYSVKTEGRNRVVDEWKMKPDGRDNHWLDGVVGCAVAASVMGVTLPGTDQHAAARGKRVKLSDVQRGWRR